MRWTGEVMEDNSKQLDIWASLSARNQMVTPFLVLPEASAPFLQEHSVRGLDPGKHTWRIPEHPELPSLANPSPFPFPNEGFPADPEPWEPHTSTPGFLPCPSRGLASQRAQPGAQRGSLIFRPFLNKHPEQPERLWLGFNQFKPKDGNSN